MLNGLDLFSGIGGLTLALDDWVRPAAYCENDRYAQSILLTRMSDGSLPFAPLWDNVQTLRGGLLPNIQIIYGGFPCQDISVAGNGKGLGGKRSGLFYEIIRLTQEISPSFVFLENVPGIRTRGLDQVLRAFTDIRYDCRWTCISAAEVGAPHLRKRWFLLAYSKGQREGGVIRHLSSKNETRPEPETEPKAASWESIHADKHSTILADSHGERFQGAEYTVTGKAKTEVRRRPTDPGEWATEPAVGRVVNGLPNRVDRIKCLGNSVVPAQARKAFESLIGISE